MPDVRTTYLTDAAAIYRQSFAIIRAETDLRRFPPEVAQVVVRMIHGCGQVDLAADVAFTPQVVTAARRALQGGAPIVCDATMVAAGVTRRRLPAANEVLCALGDPRVPARAEQLGTTRSAAALDLLRDRIPGAVVAIGNAPTALFQLLELLDAGTPPPAAIVGIPVGFVGAQESKEALLATDGLDYLTVRGRRGGSAIVASALNAIASTQE